MPSADDRAIAGLTLAAFVVLLATPTRALWSAPGSDWWAPFAVWGALVLAGAWLAWRARGDDG